MNTPAISVLVPVRGPAAFLPHALDSLRAQTFADWEALVVGIDGASVHVDDPHMRILDATAIGAGRALDDAARQARGEHLCVLDGDDLLEPAAFATLLAALAAHPGAGMAYSRHVLVDAAGTLLGPGPLCDLPYSAEALLLDCMTGPLRMLRASAYRAAGGYRDTHPDALDYDLCLRLSETTPIVHVARPLYRRRIHADAPEVARWAQAIEARYRAFKDAVRRRGLDARFDCALDIDSWHILQPLRPFGGVGHWR